MTTRLAASFSAIAVAAVALPPASIAGDREWAVAGKVLTGIAAAHVISRAFEPAPVVYYPAPAPVVVVQYQPQPSPVAVPGTYFAPAGPVYALAPAATVFYPSAPQVVYVPARAPVCVAPPRFVAAPCGYGYRPHFGGGHFHGRRHW